MNTKSKSYYVIRGIVRVLFRLALVAVPFVLVPVIAGQGLLPAAILGAGFVLIYLFWGRRDEARNR